MMVGRILLKAVAVIAVGVTCAFAMDRGELLFPKAPPSADRLLAEAAALAGPGYACRPAEAIRAEERSYSETWVACLSGTDAPDLVLIWGTRQTDFHPQGLSIWGRTDTLEESPKWNL